MKPKELLVAFEGTCGAGKSTCIDSMCAKFPETGVIKFPSEELKKQLPNANKSKHKTLFLNDFTAKQGEINQKCSKKGMVLLDRYFYSTKVCQRTPLARCRMFRKPDAIIFFKCFAEKAYSRIKSRVIKEDLLKLGVNEYFDMTRGYDELLHPPDGYCGSDYYSDKLKTQVFVVNANETAEKVAAAVEKILKKLRGEDSEDGDVPAGKPKPKQNRKRRDKCPSDSDDDAAGGKRRRSDGNRKANPKSGGKKNEQDGHESGVDSSDEK